MTDKMKGTGHLPAEERAARRAARAKGRLIAESLKTAPTPVEPHARGKK